MNLSEYIQRSQMPHSNTHQLTFKEIRQTIDSLSHKQSHELQVSPSKEQHKKIIVENAASDTCSFTDKTAKIKKNKKKKRKAKQKIYKHELCDKCSARTHFDETAWVDVDESGSEDQDSHKDENSKIRFLDYMIEDLLEDYYDEIDKRLTSWLKNADVDYQGTFVGLMAKLGSIYCHFLETLHKNYSEEFGQDKDMMFEHLRQELPYEFKTFMVFRFPLLKDFIENLNIDDLSAEGRQQIDKLRSENDLVTIIIDHMIEIMDKRKKKKNKKKKKKEEKKKLSHGSATQQASCSELENWFRELTIDDSERTNCVVEQGWVKDIEIKLSDTDNDQY